MILVASMGGNVKATKAEITTEPPRTTPNSLNNRPVSPCRKTSGMKTATSATVSGTVTVGINNDTLTLDTSKVSLAYNNAHAGTKYGIPFPVFCRASFGTTGANLPALLRALVTSMAPTDATPP